MGPDHTEPPLRYVRPNGFNRKDYEELAASDRHRLAWELLIRDSRFKQDCDQVRVLVSTPEDIAKVWKLYRFKPWDEPYSANPPRFSASAVSKYSPSKGEHKTSIRLVEGQHAYVIDFRQLHAAGASPDAQLRTLSDRARRAYVRFQKRHGAISVDRRRLNDYNIRACLQFLDLRDSKASSSDMKASIPFLADAAAETDLSGRLRDLRVRSERLIRERYYLLYAARA